MQTADTARHHDHDADHDHAHALDRIAGGRIGLVAPAGVLVWFRRGISSARTRHPRR